jgi:hypothetical protein
MCNCLFLSSILSCAILAAAQSTQPAATTPPRSPAGAPGSDRSIDWSTLEEKDPAELVQLLDSPDWPIRAIALLRLERYTGSEVKKLVEAKLHDKAWQVRCFAIGQAGRMDISISGEELADETDPHVIRAALHFGIDLPHDKLEPLAFKLLRSKGLDELMLGLEIAAASDIEPVRKEASRRAATVAKNMNDAVAALISRRLARVLGLDPVPQTARDWIAWSRTQGETIKLAAPHSQRENSVINAKPIVAEMEDETFTRLLDYLGALRQRDLDLVICMDATASMLPMVNQARAGVDSLILFWTTSRARCAWPSWPIAITTTRRRGRDLRSRPTSRRCASSSSICASRAARIIPRRSSTDSRRACSSNGTPRQPGKSCWSAMPRRTKRMSTRSTR